MVFEILRKMLQEVYQSDLNKQGIYWHNMRRHLLVVSEKKIKMLKTPFVIAQGEVLYVAPQYLLEVDPPRLQTYTYNIRAKSDALCW